MKVLVYIEDHLDEELTLDKLAEVACFSPFHFHRIFRAYLGESVYAYVKRLRLEKGAGRLTQSDKSITEIALDSGYETPAAFTKAFRGLFGMTPQNFRKQYGHLGQLVMENINLKNKKKIMLKPEIKSLDPIEVSFSRKIGPYEEAFTNAFEELLTTARIACVEITDERIFGTLLDNPEITKEDKLRCDACMTGDLGESVGRKTLPGGRYAIFTHNGPYEEIPETYRQIYSEWLSNSGEKLADRRGFWEYQVNWYHTSNPKEYVTKLYVPL